MDQLMLNSFTTALVCFLVAFAPAAHAADKGGGRRNNITAGYEARGTTKRSQRLLTAQGKKPFAKIRLKANGTTSQALKQAKATPTRAQRLPRSAERFIGFLGFVGMGASIYLFTNLGYDPSDPNTTLTDLGVTFAKTVGLYLSFVTSCLVAGLLISGSETNDDESKGDAGWHPN